MADSNGELWISTPLAFCFSCNILASGLCIEQQFLFITSLVFFVVSVVIFWYLKQSHTFLFSLLVILSIAIL